jgi:Phage capsid family
VLTYLSRLTAERDSLTQAATDVTEKAARDERDVTDTERTSLANWATRCAEIDGQLTEYNAQAESQRAYARLRSSLTLTDDDSAASTQLDRRSAQNDAQQRSWGDLFVESAAFTNYLGAGVSQRVAVPFELEQRAPIGIGTFPAQGLPPYYWTPPQYNYASPLLDVIGKVTTSSNAVSYVQWTPNPQGAASVVGEGLAKPEATMTATGVSVSLQTYAHYKEVTRQALEDVPQIRSIVEGRLRQGIVRALEDAVAAALVAATIPPATVALGGALLEAIRIGVGLVQSAGYANPNAVLLNPADFAALDIAVMNGTQQGPTRAGGFWGLTPIASNGVPAGTAYVGDFSVGVTLFSRGTTEVFLSDSHADNFIRNILLLLAETRALVTVPEPAALAECTVAAAAGR